MTCAPAFCSSLPSSYYEYRKLSLQPCEKIAAFDDNFSPEGTSSCRQNNPDEACNAYSIL